MTRRMIDSSMWQNEKFTELPICARLLQISLINTADDQGRAKATPKYLKIQVFPYDDIALDDIQKWLEDSQDNGTIILYTVDGKQYAQHTNWWKYKSLQYAQPSQVPRPEGWQDRIRRTATKGVIVTCNWFTVDGARLDDTCDQDGNPIQNLRSKPPKPPANNQPTPVKESPVDSPSHSPEPTGEDTRLTKDKDKEETTTTTVVATPEEETAPEAKSGGGGGELPLLRNRQTDTDYARLCHKFESEGFGTLTELLAEQITAMLAEHPVDWIDEAMTVAVSANKRQLRYVNGILVKWRAEGRGERKTSANGQAPSKPILSLKDWCLKQYNVSIPKFAPVGEAAVHEQYNQYRNQQTH